MSEIIKLSFNDNYYAILPTNSNIPYYKVFPTHLDIEIPDKHSNIIDDVILNLKKEILSIYIDNSIILKIPLDFFICLNGYTYDNNTLQIKLDFKMFFGEIIFTLMYQKMIFKVSNMTEKIQNLGVYIAIEKHNVVEKPPKHMFFQQIQTHEINICEKHYKINCLFDNLVKGFFINTNIDIIETLIFTLNGHTRFYYDKILLNTICTKINNNLCYIPLDNTQQYNDCNIESYHSAINMTRIALLSNIEIFLTQDTKEQLILYGVSSNVLRTDTHICDIEYNTNF